jgi:hypothetical protein
MTSIGRFSLISETKYNPSIITFVIQLSNQNNDSNNTNHNSNFSKSGGVLTSKEFVQLWISKQMDIRHPRFHQMIINHHNHPYQSSKNQKQGDGHDHTIKNTIQNTKQQAQYLSFHPTDTTNIEQHIHESILPSHRKELQNIIAYNQIQTWDLSKSLWYVTIYNNSNTTNWNINYDCLINFNNTHDDSPTTIQIEKDMDMTTTTKITSSTSIDNNKNDSQYTPQIPPPTLLLFRGHHVLADGASMAAAFMDLFDEADTIRQQIYNTIQLYRKNRRRRNKHNTIFHWLWKRYIQLIRLCFGTIQSFVHVIRLTIHYMFIDHNPWKKIQQYYHNKQDNSTTNNQRVVSWSDVASVEQVKWVADTFSEQQYDDDKNNNQFSFQKVTVNDILISCVSAAMAKQLQFHRQQIHELMEINKTSSHKNNNDRTNKNEVVIPEQPYIHVAVPVHLKGGIVLPNESVGNNIGALVARVPCEIHDNNAQQMSDTRNTCLQRLHAVHTELNTIKRTPTALITFISAKVLSHITTWNILPSSWISKLYANANIGSMVVVSNNRGPATPVHIHGHEVESIYGFVPLPPGIPAGVVVMSYAGRINCTVSAEPWAIPDGDQFMIWILEEYLNLVDAAKHKTQQQIEK